MVTGILVRVLRYNWKLICIFLSQLQKKVMWHISLKNVPIHSTLSTWFRLDLPIKCLRFASFVFRPEKK